MFEFCDEEFSVFVHSLKFVFALFSHISCSPVRGNPHCDESSKHNEMPSRRLSSHTSKILIVVSSKKKTHKETPAHHLSPAAFLKSTPEVEVAVSVSLMRRRRKRCIFWQISLYFRPAYRAAAEAGATVYRRRKPR